MNIYSQIIKAKREGRKLLAVLIDPEKVDVGNIKTLVQLIHESIATHIFVGGSTDIFRQIEKVVKELKKITSLPVILFPGDSSQVTPKADGILFLSLLSGRNPEYLIGQQLESALQVYHSELEVLPTAYLLIDGGKQTAVERVSKTKPLSQELPKEILKTALAGQFSGKKLIYLEAGSGATNPVDSKIISLVSNYTNIPLIVGGGIKNVKLLNNAYHSGADLVVIGTAFENNLQLFNQLKKEKSYL